MQKKKTTNHQNQNTNEQGPLNVVEHILANYWAILDAKLQKVGINKVERDKLLKENDQLLRTHFKDASLFKKLQKMANEHHKKHFPSEE